jgi:hypothetical protein
VSKQILSLYCLEFSTWTEGHDPIKDASEKIELAKPNKVVLYETASSGQVMLTRIADADPAPTTLLVTDPEIFVKIRYGDDKTEYISAPLRTSLEYSNVHSIDLHIAFFVGPPGWKKAQYSCLVNAHAVYEISH